MKDIAMKPAHRSRRALLRGIGGTAVGLPLLDVFSRRARAAAPARVGDFVVYVIHCNGVMQAHAKPDEPEMFWPTAIGPITTASLAADLAAKRSTGELGPHADRLLIVRGVRSPFPSNGDGHNGGDCQILTGQRHVNSPRATPFGESIDNRIAREKNPPGREPFVLRVVGGGAQNTGAVSYRGKDDARFGDDNPQAAYERMVGLGLTDPAVAAMVQKRRLSVNDLVRGELKRVLARTDLSANDRRRLDGHLTAVRDIEVKLQGALAPAVVAQVKDVAAGAKYNAAAYVDLTMTVQLELMAFAVASGYSKVAVLKVGTRTDNYRYQFPGYPVHPFHHISHRIESGGASGPPIPTAIEQHHLIDRLYLRKFKWFVDHLASFQTPEGPLCDQGFAVFTNQCGVGYHGYSNLPWIIAGKARGYWKTGRHVGAGNQAGTLNQMHNTCLGAVGVTNPDGSPVEDFGAAEALKGRLTDLVS
jgi:hypothetical protein